MDFLSFYWRDVLDIALVTLLLYRILKKGISSRMAAAGTALFSAMYNVVQKAAQGRGYALSGFFLLAAANCLYEICIPEDVSGIMQALPPV